MALTVPASAVPVCFSVDGKAQSPPNPAEGLTPAESSPNDVFSLGTAGGHGHPTEGEVFQSSGMFGANPDGTNAVRISGMGVPLGPIAPPPAPNPMHSSSVLGLIHGDNIDALSFGMDAGRVLHFSVDPYSVGIPASDVNYEATTSPAGAVAFPLPTNAGGDPGHEAAGDIFTSMQWWNFGAIAYYRSGPMPPVYPDWNRRDLDEARLGLQAPATLGAKLGKPEDNLDALELSDAGDPQWGVDANKDGVPDGGKFVFFSLTKHSTSVGAGLAGPADILVTPGGAHAFFVYATPASMGLMPDDDIDALILSDILTRGRMDVGADEALVSLAPGSPTLAANGMSPADVIYTKFDGMFRTFVRSSQLGLLATDNVDALDISSAGGGQPTVYPEVATECPKLDTQCPTVQTSCPDRVTECVPQPTACPGIVTVCSDGTGTPTVCPVVDTECPRGDTHCPANATQCRYLPTECPRLATRCYDEPTLCFQDPAVCGEPTISPAVATACPRVYTECPAEPTVCMWIETQCHLSATLCYAITTECPKEPTLCYAEPTVCANAQTVCPGTTIGTPTVCPQDLTTCPKYQTRCPERETYCPAKDTICPANVPTKCPVQPTVCYSDAAGQR